MCLKLFLSLHFFVISAIITPVAVSDGPETYAKPAIMNFLIEVISHNEPLIIKIKRRVIILFISK